MIKIIKEGKKEFKVTCPICDCEFSYELGDLYNGIVSCPCCDTTLIAKDLSRELESGLPKDNMVWKTPEYRAAQKELERQVEGPPSFVPCDNKINPCLACPFYTDYLSQGKVYVGDNPCQWCQYSGLKVTCTSTGTSMNGVK